MSRAPRKPPLPPPEREPTSRPFPVAPARTRALVLCPQGARPPRGGRTEHGRLEEAVGLARAIDLDVVAAEIVPLRTPRPATLFGSGRVRAIGELVAAERIDLVVVDAPLSPVQQRNLERAWSCKVIDRTGLILEIFGERARTREGRLQVELAALTYQRSRLVRSWTHLERQRGGYGFLGGPGESQIELDRRRIDDRITRIQRELEAVKRTRGLHRAARERAAYPVIALVGYTNAGKSTLFNRLTGARVGARDQLFATLDPTMRLLTLPSGQQAILSDTVGFVADLPTDLIAAFRATLEEVRTADLVLHVRDLAHPETAAQRADVLEVLDSLGLGELTDEGRLLEFWNKLDLLAPGERAQLRAAAERQSNAVCGSALTGEGIPELLSALDRRLSSAERVVALELDSADGACLAWLYRHGTVLERRDADGRTRLKVALSPDEHARLQREFPGANLVETEPQNPRGGR
ncbi:MAG TPA: GTPase HflX [Geminicoccaceae bacterium]|nr:GTPase HflX [Geminicoccaceae bacterium]